MQIDANAHLAAVLLREELGDVLREYRQRQGRTLREVSSQARVSLGYLSEVERGQKEASSELLDSISKALNVPLSHVLRLVADRMDIAQGRPTPAMRRVAVRERMASAASLGGVSTRFVDIPDSIPDSVIERELMGMRR